MAYVSQIFFLQLVLILGAQSETCGERTQMELSGKVQRKQGKIRASTRGRMKEGEADDTRKGR